MTKITIDHGMTDNDYKRIEQFKKGFLNINDPWTKQRIKEFTEAIINNASNRYLERMQGDLRG